MSNLAQDNVHLPPPYTPYSPGQGFENSVQSANNPDYIKGNPDATSETMREQSGMMPETGYYPAQTGYYPAQTGYPVGEAATQQTTTVYVQPVTVVVPLDNPPRTYLVQSILVFLFCCWILGLMAILKSVASDSAAKCGRREEAEREAALARKYNTIGVAIGIFVWVGFSVTFTVLLVLSL